MTKKLKHAAANFAAFRWKRIWPQVPLGLFLLFVGAINVLTGLQSQAFQPVFQILARLVPLSQLSKEISLGILGSGVQVLLGTGLLLTGIALFWRLRSAWAFSILLLAISIVLDWFNQRDFQGIILSGTALAALVVWENRFRQRSLIGGYLMSLIGILSVFAYGVLGSLLIGSNFHPAIQDVYTALYFTVVTLSTVGSNIYPSTSEAQLFMVTLILGGISIFTTTIVTTFGPMLSSQIKPILDGKNAKKKQIDRVILMGSGSFVESLVQEFIRLGIELVQVIASDESATNDGRLIIRGDMSDPDILRQAVMTSATAVVIAGDDMPGKIAAAQTVKGLNPDAILVIVTNSSEDSQQINALHADLVFSPESVAARTLANLLTGNSIPKEFRGSAPSH